MEPAAGFGWAWLAASLALAIHVADEAGHDFLAWYNPRAMRIRRAIGIFPFPPTFAFIPWLAGLIAAVTLLLALTPLAWAARPWMRPLATVLAAVHIGNGLLHLIGSFVERRPVPGVLSAPVLLATGTWLLYEAVRLR